MNDIKICGIMFFDEVSQINEGSICLRIIRHSYWYSNSIPEIITKNIKIMMVRRDGKKCFSFFIDDEIIKDPICELALKYCDNNFSDNGAEIVQLLDYRVAVEKCAEGNYVGDEDGDFRTEFLGFLLSKI